MNVLGLCAGVGGLELGIRIAEPGARGICYVEREAYAAANLVARMEDGWLHPAPIWTDLGTFDPEPWRGVVHCVASGDPCQPNSVAGKRGGADDDRWLIDQVLRVVDCLRPDRFFRENVPGNADGQLAALVPALERMGYRVAAGIFSAAEAGASHRRERLFIMADRQGERPGEARRFRRNRSSEWSSGSFEDLVDATSARCGTGSPGSSRSLRDEAWRQEPGGRCINVADPERQGLQGRGPTIQERGSEPESCGGNGAILPLFAPGPADPRWAEILDYAPHLEPAVCRVADGLANRVDRLRAIGNGVVPLAAAYAWRTLEAALRAERGADEREPF